MLCYAIRKLISGNKHVAAQSSIRMMLFFEINALVPTRSTWVVLQYVSRFLPKATLRQGLLMPPGPLFLLKPIGFWSTFINEVPYVWHFSLKSKLSCAREAHGAYVTGHGVFHQGHMLFSQPYSIILHFRPQSSVRMPLCCFEPTLQHYSPRASTK